MLLHWRLEVQVSYRDCTQVWATGLVVTVVGTSLPHCPRAGPGPWHSSTTHTGTQTGSASLRLRQSDRDSESENFKFKLPVQLEATDSPSPAASQIPTGCHSAARTASLALRTLAQPEAPSQAGRTALAGLYRVNTP